MDQIEFDAHGSATARGYYLELNALPVDEPFGPGDSSDLGVQVVAVDELYLEPPLHPVDEPFGPDDPDADHEFDVFELLMPARDDADFALVFSGESLVGVGRRLLGKLVLRATRAALRWLTNRAQDSLKTRLQWLKHTAATKIAAKLDDRGGSRDLLRPMTPANWAQRDVATPLDWDALTSGRALLYIHGTGRSCHKGFGQGTDPGLQGFSDLYARYQGRVAGVDYRILSKSPRANVVALLQQIPSGRTLDVDVIAVSRGGLVARRLSERLGRKQIPGVSKIQVRRVVFVGTPNAGTPLADEDNLKELVQHAMVVPKLFGKLCQAWGVAAVVALIGMLLKGAASVVSHFPGLAAQSTRSELLKTLNGDGFATSSRYYAVQCRLTGGGGLTQLAIDTYEKLAFRDRDCDLIVPTRTCAAPGANGPPGSFPVRDGDVLEFNQPGRTHQNYFEAAETWDHIRACLN